MTLEEQIEILNDYISPNKEIKLVLHRSIVPSSFKAIKFFKIVLYAVYKEDKDILIEVEYPGKATNEDEFFECKNIIEGKFFEELVKNIDINKLLHETT